MVYQVIIELMHFVEGSTAFTFFIVTSHIASQEWPHGDPNVITSNCPVNKNVKSPFMISLSCSLQI